jgi:hypothetical protein
VNKVNKVSDHVRQNTTIPKTGWQAMKHTWENLASECAAYPTSEMREKVFAATLTAFSNDGHYGKSVIFNHHDFRALYRANEGKPLPLNVESTSAEEARRREAMHSRYKGCKSYYPIRLSQLTLARSMMKYSMRRRSSKKLCLPRRIVREYFSPLIIATLGVGRGLCRLAIISAFSLKERCPLRSGCMKKGVTTSWQGIVLFMV